MKSLDARILHVLRTASVHLPGADIARETGSTPRIIESRIAELREAGYDIEKRPHLGYRLVAAPDRLIADDFAAALAGNRLARDVLVFANTGSTNDLAAKLGCAGAAEGLVIFAEQQTAGRGRHGRRWHSESHKGLWFSILLRPRFSLPLWTRLTTWAAVAVAEGIDETAKCRAMIKWPNDIFIDGKKAVGILTESFTDKSRKHFAVVGIGVNVNQESFPPHLSATSLRMTTGRAVDRFAVALAILRRLDDLYAKIEGDFPSILAKANDRSYLRGRWIEARAGTKTLEGIAGPLDENGGLLLGKAGGGHVSISGGEVSILRSHPAAAV